MKSAEEWLNLYTDQKDGITFEDLIIKIQSDAFHAGKLEGLNEAREIVKWRGDKVTERIIEHGQDKIAWPPS